MNHLPILTSGKTTIETALEIFDTLDTVDLEFMLGTWQGLELSTNHPLDGWLKLSNWYGKEFIDFENVHPLLFSDNQGKIFKVAPNSLGLDLLLKSPIPQNNFLKPVYMTIISLFKTEDSQARLRMIEYRGKVSATMSYDYLPINDHFRKVDENMVMGVMDLKNISQLFCFLLKRVVTR